MARKYPYPIHEDNEDDILSQIILRDVFPTLPEKQQVVLGLRLEGFTQGAISRLMNISRTSIGSLEKQAVSTISLIMIEE
jgi:DNA-directed RNA polymerase specialized sigma subunit